MHLRPLKLLATWIGPGSRIPPFGSLYLRWTFTYDLHTPEVALCLFGPYTCVVHSCMVFIRCHIVYWHLGPYWYIGPTSKTRVMTWLIVFCGKTPLLFCVHTFEDTLTLYFCNCSKHASMPVMVVFSMLLPYGRTQVVICMPSPLPIPLLVAWLRHGA